MSLKSSDDITRKSGNAAGPLALENQKPEQQPRLVKRRLRDGRIIEYLIDTRKYGRSGVQSKHWKGDTVRHGRMMIYAPNHPYRSHDNYVFRYRLVMEAHIGRFLSPGEEVHHTNGNPLDDRIENLQVLSKSEHSKLHNVLHGKKNISRWIGVSSEERTEKMSALAKIGWAKRRATASRI